MKNLDRRLSYVMGLIVVLLALNVWFAYHNIRQMNDDERSVTQTQNVLSALENIISLAKDAETGQRGYIITGEPTYLEPYNAAIATMNDKIGLLEQLTRDNPAQQTHLAALKTHLANRLNVLQERIVLRDEKGFDAAREAILTGRGKFEMDELRKRVNEMASIEQQLLTARSLRAERSYRIALLTTVIADLFALGMVGAFIFLLRRHLLARERAAAAIHEQREMFRTTIASIGDAVMTTDTQGRVAYLNAVAQSLTGWTQEAALGEPVGTVFRIVNEQTRAAVENPVARVLREGVVVGLANHTILISKDGTERPVDDSAAPIRDQKGHVAGVVMVFRDVTERRRAENALRESEEKLRRQAQELEQQLIASGRLVSLGEITASMAHEFNNPLGIVMGFAEDLLSETAPSSPQYRALQIINEESKRCQKIIQELLEFSRPKSADLSLTDIKQAVEKTLNLVSTYLYKQKINAAALLDEHLPRIHADSQQLEQVLVNLYLNAIDAMPEGGKLTVGATLERSDGMTAPMIVITVTDTGFGIEPKDLSKIFLPFFTAKKRRGLGLGLSICERIIKNHGGQINVQSQPETGTTFTLSLPLNHPPAQSDSGSEARLAVSDDAEAALKPFVGPGQR
jgi:PAS domain S-box-containing protein